MALYYNTSGVSNTAIGSFALQDNTLGNDNTAVGFNALRANTVGGYAALRSTTTGNSNIGFGYQSLYLDATGSSNIAIGYQAGYYATGSNDIEIGNMGARDDDNVIRIGAQGTQTGTYIAGISSAQITGAAVYVTSSGQLGVLASSERYKTAITPIGESTQKLQQLRPVSFHLKTDPAGAVQYGLIAEEVDKVYPELVIRDDTGKIQGVRYDELSPMLLNEMQQQQRINAAQTAEINHLKQEQELQAAAQSAQIRGLQQQVAKLNDLKQELHAAIRQLQSKGDFVAQR